ncbi:MAG: NADPH-dependent F420 reductase [Methanomassiliicoccus sp.]|nr:NADPH-dependent F420 reductase [Methanomassiliicoccus sp.]
MKVAIIGKGKVGTAIGSGLTRVGHEVKYGHRQPLERPRKAAEWGDIVIIAVPFNQVGNVEVEIGPAVDDKIVIDATNVVGPNGELALGFSTSGAEEMQKALPLAKVVKAFNTVFAQNQSTGRTGDVVLTAFVAGDDPEAKKVVMSLMRELGFDPVDSGPLKAARYLEPMGMHLIDLGYGLGMGTAIGFRLIKG